MLVFSGEDCSRGAGEGAGGSEVEAVRVQEVRVCFRTVYTPDTVQQIRNMTAELVRRIALLPGVRSAAIAEDGPLSSRGGSSMIRLPNGETVRAAVDEVSPGFFETIGMRRLAGRDFSPADKDGSPAVVILNDVLARALFQHDNPIGRSVVAELGEPQTFQVIGVVRASRYHDLHTAPPPTVYFAIQQITAYMPTLHVHVGEGRSIADVATAVRHEFDALDAEVPVFNIKLLEDRVNDSLSRERLVSVLAVGEVHASPACKYDSEITETPY